VSQGEEQYARSLFVGATLRTLRERVRLPDGRKLTQRALADRLGIQSAAVSNWETEKNAPSAEKLSRIADELGCEVGDFFGRTIPHSAPQPPAFPDQDFLAQLFVALFTEGVPRLSAEEALGLTGALITEARTPPDSSTGVPIAVEASIRVRTLLRHLRRWRL
jgi:transcriptional regulator with XRE-family HTH domain